MIQTGRWLLFHGTSTFRVAKILAEGCLRVPSWGDKKTCLTTEWSVAEYFACNAAFGDRHDPGNRGQPVEDSAPAVLVINGERLLTTGHIIAPFRDDFHWGPGECDWESEIACWDDIQPLDELLLKVKYVSLKRRQLFEKRDLAAFKPAHLPTAEFEFAAMMLRRPNRRTRDREKQNQGLTGKSTLPPRETARLIRASVSGVPASVYTI